HLDVSAHSLRSFDTLNRTHLETSEHLRLGQVPNQRLPRPGPATRRDPQRRADWAHGAGRQWRWILHCPSLHLDVGPGTLNGIVGKARLASAFLWEQGPGLALATLYAFLVGFFGESFALQVSELHLCCDIAGWDLSLADAGAFVSRARTRQSHVLRAE